MKIFSKQKAIHVPFVSKVLASIDVQDRKIASFSRRRFQQVDKVQVFLNTTFEVLTLGLVGVLIGHISLTLWNLANTVFYRDK